VRLAGNDARAERLIEESFRFLLDREPNTSILGRFDLPVIGHYYPEYASEMRRRFGAR
jgi:predicted PolB exonuclease-like 3'-5' exonuclease